MRLRLQEVSLPVCQCFVFLAFHCRVIMGPSTEEMLRGHQLRPASLLGGRWSRWRRPWGNAYLRKIALFCSSRYCSISYNYYRNSKPWTWEAQTVTLTRKKRLLTINGLYARLTIYCSDFSVNTRAHCEQTMQPWLPLLACVIAANKCTENIYIHDQELNKIKLYIWLSSIAFSHRHSGFQTVTMW